MTKRIDQLKAIIFDFDGVILESADIKTEAFVAIFADHPEKLAEIRAYHLNNVGISRYVKFEHIQKSILGLPYDEAIRDRLGEAFSRLTKEKIMACPEIPGARELLTKLRGKVIRAVASGTPEPELVDIVESRKMQDWFDEIWGTPRAKPDIIRDVMERHRLQPHEVLMVGDGMTDYKAAMEAGTHFLAREPGGVFDDLTVEKVADLFDMDRWLASEG